MNQRTPAVLLVAVPALALLPSLAHPPAHRAHLTAAQTADRPADLPADLAAVLARARTALAGRNAAALKALADEPGRLTWIGPSTLPGRPGWQLDALAAPNRTPNSPRPTPYLAIFHEYHTCESIGDHIYRMVRTPAGWRFGPEIPETETLGYRMLDHALNVAYDLPKQAVRITDDVKLERTTAPADGLCLLRLSSNLRVDSATVDGRPWPVAHAPGVVALIPPPAKTCTLQLAYHGAYDQPGMDNYVHENEAVLNSFWYPHIARLPAKQRVTATVPKGWTADSEGELLRHEEQPDGTVFTFRNEIPTTWFSLDAGKYDVTRRESNGLRLAAYQLKPDAVAADRALDRLAKALAFFSAHFGPYPYTHYEMVGSQGPFGGALEAYSFATFQGNTFAENVHELSHTWWGGIVPNTYLHSQWNESFAEYSDALFERFEAGRLHAPALRGMHPAPGFGRALARAYAVPVAEAFDTDNPMHDAVGYGKGAQVMAMLEDLLGTETMLRCMRRFRDDQVPFRAAEWPDFARAVRETTGRDYGWFFAQWVERGGVPVVKLTDVRWERAAGKQVATGAIVQEGAPYRLRLPLALEAQDGTKKREVVEASSARTPFRIAVATSSPLKGLDLDPDGTVLMAGGKMANGLNPFRYLFSVRQ